MDSRIDPTKRKTRATKKPMTLAENSGVPSRTSPKMMVRIAEEMCKELLGNLSLRN